MEKSNYYSKNQLLSYNCLFNFVTGARGIGKTYQFKTWAISDFIRTGSTCWWIMRYQTEIDTIIKDGRFSLMCWTDTRTMFSKSTVASGI